MVLKTGLSGHVRSWMMGILGGRGRALYHSIFRLGVRSSCTIAALTDRFQIAGSGFDALPPPLLRYRVGETVSLDSFLTVGREAGKNLNQALARVGRPLRSFHNVLDFGCGCGRTLIWLLEDFPGTTFFGTDVDPLAIAWCQQNLRAGTFTTNAVDPPLGYENDSFDLIYALSVFTHLDQPSQLDWLRELKRVLKPSGVLLVTVHGSRVWEGLEDPQIEQIREAGHLETDASRLRGICPEWYRTSFHTRQHVLETFGRHFEKMEYLPGGLGYQDMVICQRSVEAAKKEPTEKETV